MAKITLENITKIFAKEVIAVHNVSLEVSEGEVMSLLGPSGCGKTTTMRIIAGFESPNSGKVYINGQDVTHLPPGKRNISMVFQFPVVYDTISIYENLAAPLKALKLDKKKIDQFVNEVANRFGISKEIWHQKAKNLSISERQRLSLAHAFIIERNLYILDEPFSNVDPKSRVILMRYVREVQRKMKHTVMFVTHSQSEALTISDKIAVMKEGKIVQCGTPDEVYSEPVDTFVAWFLGNPGMNFINCFYKQKNGIRVLDAGPFIAHEKIPEKYAGSISNKKEVILGIRPEDIEISLTQKENYIPGICRYTEPIGSRVLLNVELPKNIAINVKIPRDVTVLPGDKIHLYFPSHKIRLFDKETGKALR